ncbi:MAG: hypothetical protein KBD06_04430 [Candidatus Pacebacteria bacterium]|nr:hypothetical protein [Candidatus Paceibacterota bacterium]
MDILRRGEVAGILCVIFLVASIGASFVLGVGKSVTGDTVSLILYLAICVAYFVLILAVRHIAQSTGDAVFSSRMRDFYVAMVVICPLLAPLMAPLFITASVERILSLVMIAAFAILGIVSIRVAPSFEKLEGSRALYGRKAGKWLRISGWLMATVILSIVGGFLSLFADYYLWRMIRQERLSGTN